MTEVRGCQIPEELYYWIEKHVWVRDDGDDVLTHRDHRSGPAPRRARRGRHDQEGRQDPRARPERGHRRERQVGRAGPDPGNGEIVAVNEALAGEPDAGQHATRTAPAGSSGSRRPSGRSSAPRCTPVPHAVEEYRAFLEREGISCG